MGVFARFGRLAEPDAAHHGLLHAVNPLLGSDVTQILEGKDNVIRSRGCAGYSYRQLSAEMAVDKRGLVSVALYAVGVNAQLSEVTGLPFRSSRTHKQILRLRIAGEIFDAIEFEPSNDARAGGACIIGKRCGDVEFKEAPEKPTRHGSLLRGMGDNEPPVLFLSLRGTGRSFLLAGGMIRRLHLNGFAGDQIDGNVLAELANAGRFATGLDVQIAEYSRVAARFDRHRRGFDCKLASLFPQFRGKQLALANPTGRPVFGANLDLILKTLKDVEPLAKADGSDGLAHLGGGAIEGDLAIACVSEFRGRFGMMKAQICSHCKNYEEGETNCHFAHQDRASLAQDSE